MLASLEDNYSDLNIAAIESINGFHKKTGESFDEMIKNKLFDQYTKTCLWTAKARKGIKLSERMPFRNRHVSIDEMRNDEESPFDIADASAIRDISRVDAADIVNTYDYKVRKVIKALESKPELMSDSGNIKINPLAKELGVSVSKVKDVIKFLEDKNEYN